MRADHAQVFVQVFSWLASRSPFLHFRPCHFSFSWPLLCHSALTPCSFVLNEVCFLEQWPFSLPCTRPIYRPYLWSCVVPAVCFLLLAMTRPFFLFAALLFRSSFSSTKHTTLGLSQPPPPTASSCLWCPLPPLFHTLPCLPPLRRWKSYPWNTIVEVITFLHLTRTTYSTSNTSRWKKRWKDEKIYVMIPFLHDKFYYLLLLKETKRTKKWISNYH